MWGTAPARWYGPRITMVPSAGPSGAKWSVNRCAPSRMRTGMAGVTQ